MIACKQNRTLRRVPDSKENPIRTTNKYAVIPVENTVFPP